MIHHIRFCYPVSGKHEWHAGQGRVANIMNDKFVILKTTKNATIERVVPMSNIAYIEQDIPKPVKKRSPTQDA